MEARGFGRVINIGSLRGKTAKASMSPYVVAQHAVAGLIKSVAWEAGGQGVAINGLMHGPGAEPVAIGAAAVLLASPGVGSLTGTLYPVDAGASPY